eukprot:CAMPEP_0177706368 /NCGR_PEP_ID=MMETSP0484_2-20121128/9188_1 /TAXON_ID=354590 /ORGANISM="Rhodomonas lens, Strain RHODO" /LENGTH=342 /DNA_ID=CAMNT_0019217825 /DNA_START=76 /DNA_END=1104 /DNA_ORIENTATION=-
MPKRGADDEKKLRLTVDEKFWEISIAGKETTVTFGKIGTSGQAQTKDHGSAAAAQKFYDKMVNEKKKKGYSEGDGDGGDEDEDEDEDEEPAPKKAKSGGTLRLVMDEKFWEISMDGSSTTVTYGKIDTKGQTQTKDHGSADKAQKFYDKMVKEKRGKGYEDDEDGEKDDEDEDEDGEFNEATFWDEGSAACDAVITDALIEEVEKKCGGYKLPPSYVDFLKRTQNGGTPGPKNSFKFGEEDRESVETIYGIGGENASSSLCSERSNWLDEWEYPDVGLYFADTSTGGHNMWCLHYGKCGKNMAGGKEPRVVLIEQEDDFSLRETGCTFGEFVQKLSRDEEDD